MSLSAKFVLFALGAVSVLTSAPLMTPLALLALTALSEVLQLLSDDQKGHAEGLLRKLDFCQSFGREISAADVRDIVLDAPNKLRKKLEGSTLETGYFASTQPPSPRTAIENLLESAWYTRRLAHSMTVLYAFLITCVVSASIWALAVTASSTYAATERERAVKVTISWLLLIVSLSMAKNVIAYSKMAQRCQRSESTCEHLLRSDVLEGDALKQWHEYQLARAASPLLPQWLWGLKRADLDEAWRIARAG
jgi:hypothetical protein